MTVEELSNRAGFEVVSGKDGLAKEISGCYIGDLLSLAMSSVKAGNIWITIQTNINIVAVSVLTEAACVLLCDGQKPDDAAVKKSNMEDIPILQSTKSAYELACILHDMGI